jgi:hypothetical protein
MNRKKRLEMTNIIISICVVILTLALICMAALLGYCAKGLSKYDDSTGASFLAAFWAVIHAVAAIAILYGWLGGLI